MFQSLIIFLLLGSSCSGSIIRTENDEPNPRCSIEVGKRKQCSIFTNDKQECIRVGCCYENSYNTIVKCFKSKVIAYDKCEVEESLRKDCGFRGITPPQCVAKGCCFAVSNIVGFPWCFHAAETTKQNFVQTDNEEIKNALINKFKSGLDSLFENNFLAENDPNSLAEDSSIPTWLQTLLNEVSITNSDNTPENEPSFSQVTTYEDIVAADEKACKNTYDLYLSMKGYSVCQIEPIRRIRCVSSRLIQLEGESECTACTKLDCCYDPSAKNIGAPFCYKSINAIRPTTLPMTTTTTPIPTTKPRWMQLLTEMGGLPGSTNSLYGQISQNNFNWPTNQNTPWSQSQTSNILPGIFPSLSPSNGLPNNMFESSLPNSNTNTNLGKGSAQNNFFNSLLSLKNLGSTITNTPGQSASNNLANLINTLNSGKGSTSSNQQQQSNGGTSGQSYGSTNLANLMNALNSNKAGGSGLAGNTQQQNVFGTNQAPKDNKIADILSSLNSGNKFSGSNTAGSNSLLSLLGMNTPSNPSSGAGLNLPGLPGLSALLSGNSGTNRIPSFQNSFASKYPGLKIPSTYNPLLTMFTTPKPTTVKPTTKPQGKEPKIIDSENSQFPEKFLPPIFEKSGNRVPDKLCYPNICGTLGGRVSERASQRIVGGQWAGGIDYWPWMASFRRNFTDDWTYKHVCGAALISKKWILTAGHCFMLYRSKSEKVIGEVEKDVNVFVVNLGTYYRDSAELTTQVCAIEKFITHPKYDFKGLKHDIAVAKLKDIPEFTDYVRPVCLPNKATPLEVGARTWVTGWGETLRVGSHNQSKLKELALPLISSSKCESQWQKHFHDSWICTEGAYLEDACTGDSGGPLVHQDMTSRWDIIGVAIAGTKRCSTDKRDIRPGIYTNVAYYREFIDTASNGGC